MRNKLNYLLVVSVLFILMGCSVNKTLDQLVNPFIGTDFHGHTFPGATAPYGAVQLSPDTRLEGWDGCSGYHYSDSIIYGFSHTHLSGTGISDYADILFMPTVGKPIVNQKLGDNYSTENSYASKFSHQKEKATAAYYYVHLDDYNIDVELTATERTGVHKYTFNDKAGNIIVDLKHRDDVINSYIKIVSKNEIEGMRRSKAWAHDQIVYFVAKFSQDFDTYGIAIDSIMNTNIDMASGKDIKAYFRFDEIKKPIVVNVAISAVSAENARENMTFEGDFEAALSYTKKLWNEELSKVKVKTISDDDKVVFYTALYHSMIAPNLYSDKNGDYRGVDKHVYRGAEFNYYTVFSLWDTYRATHPLLNMIDKQRSNDFIKTFLEHFKQRGELPVWELSANETYCMIGYHAVPVIYDAYMKGIRDYDIELALEAMQQTAKTNEFGKEAYHKYGFVPADQEGESVSKTLEYAYDDWCIAQMAKNLNNEKIYHTFNKRAQSYKNLFDRETNFFRAKIDNTWFNPFDPKEVNFNYTEANCWQYNFYVPHDINTHIDMVGGEKKYDDMLDLFFSDTSATTGRTQADITGLIGQYAHGNEPSHHAAYLYNYIGKPWKTQEKVRKIMKDLYFNAADGLCGNDDCGQMSSWYVLSALGFYPVCPGDGKFVIGSPNVTYAELKTHTGNIFTIKTKRQSEKNIYIDKIILNGKDYDKSYITYDDIMNGGEIVFVMARNKNKKFAKAIECRPVNAITDEPIVPVPYFTNTSTTFFKNMLVKIASPYVEHDVYYTLDGSEPTIKSNKYMKPIRIEKTTTVKAIAVNDNGTTSDIVKTQFLTLPEGRSIKLYSKYPNQYSAGGDNALIDGIRGGKSFKTGRWQGYQGQDFKAIVDLGTVQKVNDITIGFIQDYLSWIFLPVEVEFAVSKDGKKYTKVGSLKNDYPLMFKDVKIKDFSCKLNKRARYVKITAKNIMTCPKGHPGEGHPAWLFADEIIIK